VQKPPYIFMGLTAWRGDMAMNVKNIASVLARHSTLIYTDYPYTLKDLLWALLGLKPAPVGRLLGWQPRLMKVATNYDSELHVLHLWPLLPINWIGHRGLQRLGLKINAWMIRQNVRAAMRQLAVANPVVVNGLNPLIGLDNIGKFGERGLVYYCYDQITAARWIARHGQWVEPLFMAQVDVTITTSQALLEEKQALTRRIGAVKNGVEYGLFHQAFGHGPQNARPQVGYIGVVDDRIDYPMIGQAATRCPNIDFVFYGRLSHPELAAPIRHLPNVKFHDFVPYQEVPQKVADMDLCMIPFVKSEFTRNIYPLKINEYLAAGKPVVKTDFAHLPDFEGIVSTSTDLETFVAAIAQELATDSEAKREQRAVFAQQNSWEARGALFAQIIDEALQAKRPGGG
jgi:glycosyltransferase involved in cell wall biosynthesis